MSNGYKIGNIFGIDIKIHWTLALLLFISIIPLSYGDYLLFLIILLLFICVFLHELAHSITALTNNIKVSEIVLNIIGGASIIDITKTKPNIEFKISLAGPIASLFLGGVFGIFSVLYTSGGVIAYLLQLMFEINILLGIFNLMPTFPMDGGRILKSYLQKKRKEFDATMLTAKISSIIIALFLFLSFVYTIYVPGSLLYKEFEFFILLFIAIFLYGGSEAEKETAIIKHETQGLTIGAIAGNDFTILPPDISAIMVYKKALKLKQDILLIKNNKEFRYIDPFKARNSRIKTALELSSPCLSLDHKESVFNAMSKLQSSGTGIAVVIRGNKPIGIITMQRIQSFIYLHMLAKKVGKSI